LSLQVFRVDILVAFIVIGRFALPAAETTAAAAAAAGENRTAQHQTLQGLTDKQILSYTTVNMHILQNLIFIYKELTGRIFFSPFQQITDVILQSVQLARLGSMHEYVLRCK